MCVSRLSSEGAQRDCFSSRRFIIPKNWYKTGRKRLKQAIPRSSRAAWGSTPGNGRCAKRVTRWTSSGAICPVLGARDIARLSQDVHRKGLTPGKVAAGLMRRLPPQLHPDLQRRNQLLLAQAARFQPDIIWLSGDNRVILPATLARLKSEHDCKIIYVSGVSPIVFSQAIERDAAPLYDLVLVNDYYHGVQWQELGARRVECLPYVGVDPALHYPQPITDVPNEYLCDVGFVGTLLPDNLYGDAWRHWRA